MSRKKSLALFWFFIVFYSIFYYQDLSAQSLVLKPQLTIETLDPVSPGQIVVLKAKVDLPSDHYQEFQSEFFRLETSAPLENLSLKTSDPVLRDGKEVFIGQFIIELTMKIPAQQQDGNLKFQVVLGYQICHFNGICLLPAELTQEVELIVNSDSQPLLNEKKFTSLSLISLMFNLLLAFVGGLLLNLMPCIFPILSLKALQLAQHLSDVRRFRRDALAFSAGIIISLGVLGGLVAVFHLAGQFLSWGFYFQNPFFVWILVLLFWVASLSLWGIGGQILGLKLSFQRANMKKDSWMTSFSSGVLEVLVAAPCTAPLLGPAIGYAFSQPSLLIFLFFVVVGLGLALPHLVLAYFPAVGRFLPSPGAWVDVFERIMGFFLAATSLYLMTILNSQLGSAATFKTLTVILVLTFFLWVQSTISFLTTRFGKIVKFCILAMILIVGGIQVFQSGSTLEHYSLNDDWIPFSRKALDQAIAEGETIFVNATASWCVTCQVNEALVLSRQDVKQAFNEAKILKLKADYTRPNSEITSWLYDVGRAGLPVYAFYRPGKVVKLLPELLNASNLIKEITKAQ